MRDLMAELKELRLHGMATAWAVVILASPNTLDHSAKLRLVVITTLVCSYSLDSR